VPVLGRVVLGGSHSRTRGLPQLVRLVNSGGTNVLFLAGPKNTRRARRQLAAELRHVIGWSRDVVWFEGKGDQARKVHRAEDEQRTHDPLVIIDDPTPAEVATRPASSLTLLVVREGIGQAALGREAEIYFDGESAGVVLVRGSRWRSRAAERKPHLHPVRQRGESRPRWRPDDGSLAAGTAD
jgi:hypothetical protein